MLTEVEIARILDDIAARLAPSLYDESKALIKLGMAYLDKNDISLREQAIKEMQVFEKNNINFALDPNQFQITLTATHQFSQISIHRNEKDELVTSVIDNLVDLTISEDATPHVKKITEQLNACKKPVIGFLGGVRKALHNIDELADDAVNALCQRYGYVAILNAGYSGLNDNLFGITRAAHQSATAHPHSISLVITSEVGKPHCHHYPTAVDYSGQTWNDLPPALISGANAFMVFGPYGHITELEIATALRKNKPIVIFNPTQAAPCIKHTHAACGYEYDKPVYSYNTYEAAEEALSQHPVMKENFDKAQALTEACRQYFNPNTPLKQSPYKYKKKEGGWVRQHDSNHTAGSSPSRASSSNATQYTALFSQNANFIHPPLLTAVIATTAPNVATTGERTDLHQDKRRRIVPSAASLHLNNLISTMQ